MTEKDVVKFYRENRDLIVFIEEHGSQEMRKIASAIKLAAEQKLKREQ